MKPIKLLGYTTAALVCLLAAVLLFAPHTAYADACTSTGTGAWETSGNWSCSKVPDSSDSVTIANGHTITIGTGSEDAYYVGDVTVDAGGTLILARGIRVVNTPFNVNGTLQLNGGGFVELGNIPLYGSGSTLIYNRTWTLNNTEWATGTSAEQRGVPYHVVINTGVTVTTSDTGQRAVLGNITISGTLVHALNSGELLIAGNWTRNGGTFTQNSTSYVNFAGSTPQTIAGNTINTFKYLMISNVYEDVTLLQNITIPSGGVCSVNGRLNLADKYVSGAGGFSAADGATLTLGLPEGIESDTAGNIRVRGGLSFGLRVNLVYNGTSAQFTGSSSPATVGSLTINNSAGVTLNRHITNLYDVLFLQNGRLTLGNYNLILSADGSIGGTFSSSNMVVTNGTGYLRKYSPSVGSFDNFIFPVGDSSGKYTPVVLNCATFLPAGDSSVYVRVKPFMHDEMTGDNYLARYWTLEPVGVEELTCNNTKFYYVQSDVQGDESQLTPVKYDAATGWRVLLNRSMDTENNVMTGGFTSLSDFSAGQPGPLSVALAEFDAQQVDDSVLVSWETNSELNNRGFNLYRGVSPDGWDRRLNDALIPSQSQGSPGGFFYTWQDRADLQSGQTYWYWLEDLDINGATTLHGPVSALYLAPTAVTLNSVSASPVSAAALPWLWTAAAAGLALGVSRRRRR